MALKCIQFLKHLEKKDFPIVLFNHLNILPSCLKTSSFEITEEMSTF